MAWLQNFVKYEICGGAFSRYQVFNVFFLDHIILFEDERKGKGNVWAVLNGADLNNLLSMFLDSFFIDFRLSHPENLCFPSFYKFVNHLQECWN